MIKRLSVILVLSLFVVFIFAGGAFGATANKSKTSLKPSSEQPFVSDAPPPAPYKYTPSGGVMYKSNCLSILPSVGVKKEHTQVGDTWYDFQKNGSIGRMISVTSAGYRHVSWMYTNGPYTGAAGTRMVKGNCEPPAGNPNWIGASTAHDRGNAGYCNQSHLSDGTPLIVYHSPSATPTPTWYCAITADDEPCGGFFTRHWDIPDYILNAPSAQAGEWPKFEVQYDNVSGRDYIHVVMTEGNTAGGVPVMVAYERCYIKDGPALLDTMVCQSYRGGATQTYKVVAGANGGATFSTISHFDSSCSITPVVAVSKVSKKVAIAFLKPADPAGTCDYGGDVCYIESMNLGNDWIDGTVWPAPEFNITHYGLANGERGYSDLSACYDYKDSLHIIWSAPKFDAVDGYTLGITKLYHWSKKSGTSIVAQSNQEAPYTISGAHNAFIAKMSISASDPIWHPTGDSVYLWAIWTQFDSSDLSSNEFGNGDLKGSGSNDGGATWGGKYNLTNTHTPGCAAGACLSEHWSSMAQNMWQGDLHIEYVCDQDAGGAIQDTPSAWMSNPMMYLRLSEWPLDAIPGVSVSVISPTSWYGPPLKITPNGSKTLTYRVYSIGNANLVFSVSSDNSCISATVPPTALAPRDSATLTASVSGSGACNNTFISGNITVSSNDPQYPTLVYPVQAVVSNEYYECPRDMATNDTLKNGVFNFYIDANGKEWVHDTSFAADTNHQVFFQGGPFVATKIAGDTLVGRYYGSNDAHTLARVDLKRNDMYNDFWLEYSWNVSIHDLNPPTVDTKWWWFDILHENVFFKSTASDNLKHTVIKFITVERHNPPGWWPTQPTFTNYEDTYIGLMMDIDCPYDSFAGQSARNRAGYDATNNIAWQRGWDFTGAHPQYNDYYAGIALAQGYQPGESVVPWGTYNLRNDSLLYPQSPWGWKEGDFYRLAAGNVLGAIQHPDSIVDRSQIVTARKIVAGSNASLKASFTVIEAVGTTPGIGPTQLAARVNAARAFVTSKYFILCGDANNSGAIEVGDIVTLINYLYKGYPASVIVGPFNRADNNASGAVEVGDIVTLINYLYKGYAASTVKCPGVW